MTPKKLTELLFPLKDFLADFTVEFDSSLVYVKGYYKTAGSYVEWSFPIECAFFKKKED